MINGEHIPFASANLDHTEMSQDQLIRLVRTFMTSVIWKSVKVFFNY